MEDNDMTDTKKKYQIKCYYLTKTCVFSLRWENRSGTKTSVRDKGEKMFWNPDTSPDVGPNHSNLF
jgi:hypothetical protein